MFGKKRLAILIVAALAGVLFFAIFMIWNANIIGKPQVCIKNNCYAVEVVDTEALRKKGLMFREEMDVNRGMLFEFDMPGIYPFWMKNTLISLDIIWLDDGGKIVFIYHNARPCGDDYCSNINPEAKATQVLEVNAGEMKRIGAEVGDQAVIRD